MSLLPMPDPDALRRLKAEREARKAPGAAVRPQTAPPLPVPLPPSVRAARAKPGGKAGRQRARVPTEHEEQAEFFRRVDADPRTRDLPIYAVPNFAGHHGSKWARLVSGKRAKREGRRKGAPDVVVDVPSPLYHGLRLELKRQRDGRTAPEQRAFHALLRAFGLRVEVCKGADKAWAVLCDYLGITPIEEADRAAA